MFEFQIYLFSNQNPNFQTKTIHLQMSLSKGKKNRYKFLRLYFISNTEFWIGKTINNEKNCKNLFENIQLFFRKFYTKNANEKNGTEVLKCCEPTDHMKMVTSRIYMFTESPPISNVYQRLSFDL